VRSGFAGLFAERGQFHCPCTIWRTSRYSCVRGRGRSAEADFRTRLFHPLGRFRHSPLGPSIPYADKSRQPSFPVRHCNTFTIRLGLVQLAFRPSKSIVPKSSLHCSAVLPWPVTSPKVFQHSRMNVALRAPRPASAVPASAQNGPQRFQHSLAGQQQRATARPGRRQQQPAQWAASRRRAAAARRSALCVAVSAGSSLALQPAGSAPLDADPPSTSGPDTGPLGFGLGFTAAFTLGRHIGSGERNLFAPLGPEADPTLGAPHSAVVRVTIQFRPPILAAAPLELAW